MEKITLIEKCIKSLAIIFTLLLLVLLVEAIIFILPVPIAASPGVTTKVGADVDAQPSPTGPPEWVAHPPIHIRRAATTSPTGLSPVQIKTVYNLPSTGGSGTIAIIDAFDDPTVLNDLNVFSTQFGLPAMSACTSPPPSGNPCFEKVMMAPTIRTNSGWALEISLDTQWAHAIAPNSRILLVEAKSNSGGDLLNAVNYARSRSDVVAISMSWGGGEFSTESSYDSYFTSSYGATFFASSGDSGTGVQWPAVSSNVVGVGGTTLNFNPDGSLASETAWSGSGGGLSAYETEPSYQISYNIPGANGKRAVPDVSYDADPNSGVSVYDSTPYNGQTGWWQVGGTSVGAPNWAAIQSLGLSASNNNFYQDAKSASYSLYFRDITIGSNGPCGFYCNAMPGYDYVTGLGSPLTTNYKAAPTPDFSISASPSALTIQAGNSGNSMINVTSLNGFSGTVSLSTSAPASLNVALSSSSLAVTSGGFNSSTLTIGTSSATAAGIYTVTVTGTSGSLSHSTSVTVTVQTVPSSPQNLVATSGNAQVTLSWQIPASDGGSAITNYSIYRSTVSGGEASPPLATVGNVLTYTDTAVTNGVTYYYKVTAVNSVGESTMSNEANAIPSASLASADFSLSAAPNTLNVAIGSSRTATITLSSINGFSGSISLSISPTITGVTTSFNPNPVTVSSGGSAQSTLMVVDSSATAGTYSLTVTGTSGSLSHSITIKLMIK